MISERIKTTLNDLVHPDQTAFITRRYIRENTCLIFDVRHDFEFSNSNKNGLIMIIDYSKAFNTIEWNFINTCLKKLNFGDNLLNMVKLLQKASFSKIEQNGYFSQEIMLGRGRRQGDPISPYLFVLSAEILSTVVRECRDVRGLMMGG